MKLIKRQRGALSIWLVLLLLGAGAVIGGTVVALWVIGNVDARLVLADQPAEVTVPEPFTARAKVTENLKISLDEVISTSVPVDVDLSLPVKNQLNINAEFDGEVPIKMDVRVQDSITIDQVLDVDAVIDANFLGDWHKLPIKGKVPVKATVPVDLIIPVDKMVRLKFKTPVKARIKDNLNVPLKTVIEADIPIQSTLDVPVLSDLVAEVTLPPEEPLPVNVHYADLLLPLRTLSLGFKEEGEQQTAAANPPPEASPLPAQPADKQGLEVIDIKPTEDAPSEFEVEIEDAQQGASEQ
ncbi:MAG: hypothetical protein R3352_07855 [Salinisphaeraceae bacterium]|nr:hypothetical protein [Salinisphaeraceae bacterium]